MCNALTAQTASALEGFDCDLSAAARLAIGVSVEQKISLGISGFRG
jgi:hypothetical protein